MFIVELFHVKNIVTIIIECILMLLFHDTSVATVSVDILLFAMMVLFLKFIALRILALAWLCVLVYFNEQYRHHMVKRVYMCPVLFLL